MTFDTFSIALSGVAAGTTRLANSAHNVANALTDGFRNRRTQQVSRNDGGVDASTVVDRDPAPVSFAREAIEQKLASFQVEANLRTLQTDVEVRGTLLDTLA